MGDFLINKTDYDFPGQRSKYRGKVKDIYDLGDQLIMVTTDRFSVLDRVLAVIPSKGELLTQVTKWWFDKTDHIVKNHVIDYPDPNVIVCKKYKRMPLEFVMRGYVTGVTNTSIWTTYSNGKRDYGDFTLPDGLKKNDKLPEPVVTPTTKLEASDRNLSPEQAIKEGLVSSEDFDKAKEVALKLFKYGQELAEEKGLILVDTKYEFGISDEGEIILIDEVHTPDTARYWLKDTLEQRLSKGLEPENHDKEIMRFWYKKNYNPEVDKTPPEPTEEVKKELITKYAKVYEKLYGKKFTPSTDDPIPRIEKNIMKYLKGTNGQA